jgi:hypothetical protein
VRLHTHFVPRALLSSCILAVTLAVDAGARPEPLDVRIETVRLSGGRKQVIAHNGYPAVVTVTVHLEGLDGARLDGPPEATLVVPPGQTGVAFTLAPARPGTEARFERWEYHWKFGSKNAVHDPNAVYRLPWGGKRALSRRARRARDVHARG